MQRPGGCVRFHFLETLAAVRPARLPCTQATSVMDVGTRDTASSARVHASSFHSDSRGHKRTVQVLARAWRGEAATLQSSHHRTRSIRPSGPSAAVGDRCAQPRTHGFSCESRATRKPGGGVRLLCCCSSYLLPPGPSCSFRGPADDAWWMDQIEADTTTHWYH